MTFLTLVFVALIFLAATQDIAVDGWALTLLSQDNLSYASTAQTIGLNTGYFLSFTVFLAFNSVEFGCASVAPTPPLLSSSLPSHLTLSLPFLSPFPPGLASSSNKYFRSTPLETPLLTLGGYMRFWSYIYVALTVWIWKYQPEVRPSSLTLCLSLSHPAPRSTRRSSRRRRTRCRRTTRTWTSRRSTRSCTAS